MEPKGGNEEKEVFGRGMAGGGDGFGQFGERRALQNDGVYVSREEHVVTDDGLGLGRIGDSTVRRVILSFFVMYLSQGSSDIPFSISRGLDTINVPIRIRTLSACQIRRRY